MGGAKRTVELSTMKVKFGNQVIVSSSHEECREKLFANTPRLFIFICDQLGALPKLGTVVWLRPLLRCVIVLILVHTRSLANKTSHRPTKYVECGRICENFCARHNSATYLSEENFMLRLSTLVPSLATELPLTPVSDG
jgi:hypothetical protein